ncbi:MAG: class I SAM-dependent methyltransferase [Pyrinomonadaceae bacterium]
MSIENQISSQFLDMPLSPATMMHYTVRSSILESVKTATAQFRGVVLDVGCGLQPYRKIIENNPRVEKYIGMDIKDSALYGHVAVDLNWNGKSIPLEGQSVDCVMATEFLEHYSEPETILIEIGRVLKPGGKFFGTVPFIWNLHEIPSDEYRYTPYSLERHLRNAGFCEIEIKALGGWNMSFAQMIGLWTTFSKMSKLRRAVLKRLLFPFYFWLIKTDRRPEKFDGWENSMYNGLSITALK